MKDLDSLQHELETTLIVTANVEPGQLVGRLAIVQKLLELLGGWQGLIGHLPKDEVKKLVMDFYASYVKPLDIPGVPFFVEGLVDDAIERLLERVIDGLFEGNQEVS